MFIEFTSINIEQGFDDITATPVEEKVYKLVSINIDEIYQFRESDFYDDFTEVKTYDGDIILTDLTYHDFKKLHKNALKERDEQLKKINLFKN